MAFLARPFAVCLCFCFCLLGNPAAAAQSTSSAEVVQFGYELIDLDPSDSIVPAITVDSSMHAMSMYRPWGEGGDHPFQMDQIFTFGSTSVANPVASASSTFDATSGRTESSFTTPTAIYQEVFGRTEYRLTFTLTPMTAIRFTALASVDAAQEGSDVYSYAGAAMIGTLFDLTLDQWSFAEVLNTDGGPDSRSLFGYMETGDTVRQGYVSLDINAMSYGRLPPPVPVPEPSTWALLLCGLGLIAWRATRAAEQTVQDTWGPV